MWPTHSPDENKKTILLPPRKSPPNIQFHYQQQQQQQQQQQHHDIPKLIYHHPPLTHHRSSPSPSPTGKSPSQSHHRQISMSPVSSCDSPTLTRHFSAEDSMNRSIRRIRIIKETGSDPSAGLTLCGGPEVGESLIDL